MLEGYRLSVIADRSPTLYAAGTPQAGRGGYVVVMGLILGLLPLIEPCHLVSFGGISRRADGLSEGSAPDSPESPGKD